MMYATKNSLYAYQGNDGLLVCADSAQGCLNNLQAEDPLASFILLLDGSAILHFMGKQFMGLFARVH